MENKLYFKELNFKNFINEFENDKKNEYLDKYPLVYIIKNNKIAYIGETTDVKSRMKSHLKNRDRLKLNEVQLIGYEAFNKSATYNIETNLINYMLADGNYTLQNSSQIKSIHTHNYYNKKFFNETLFKDIWRQLQEKGIAKADLDVLENTDIYKLSPFKMLSFEQLDVKQKVVNYCELNSYNNQTNVFIVKGEAGTGKSVLLSSLFKTLNDRTKRNDSNLYSKSVNLIVNHNELVQSFQNMVGNIDGITKKQISKSTPFINDHIKNNCKSDITLIDEAHLLLSKPDSFNSSKYENHLVEIIKLSGTVILFFDEKQFLRVKSYWDEKMLNDILRKEFFDINIERYELMQQHRMNSNDSISKWINDFSNGHVSKIPESTSKFELKYFENFKDMHDAIIDKNNIHGLSRVVSTFDYKHSKKSGIISYVELDGYKLPWNTNDKKLCWAERKETINEVGSIFTVQGFDLNYVGVVLGPSVSFNTTTSQLEIDSSKYQDIEGYRNADKHDNPDLIKQKIVLNSINVLIKRGIKGLYICSYDKKLLELI